MNTLDVKEAARAELRRINTPELAFHSGHEAWAVLLEEVEEADAELAVIKQVTDELKEMVFCDDANVHLFDALAELYNRAINAAAEAVQVAAVASKFANYLAADEEDA